MKGFTLLIFALIMSFSVDAQWTSKAVSVKGDGILETEKREISNFTELDVSGAVDVKIYHSEDQRVEVTSDQNLLEYIKTSVSGNVLSIKTEANIRKSKEITISVYTPSFNKIEISGASDLWVKDAFSFSRLKIETSGASNIDFMKINAETLNIESSGASDLELNGTCGTLVLDVSGSSDVIGKGLEVRNVDVSMSGASDLSITVSGQITGSLSGSSDLVYFGNPSKVDVDVSGASDMTPGN